MCLIYSQGLGCPVNYNPADYFIMTLAVVPDAEEECKQKVDVSKRKLCYVLSRTFIRF